jgi:hypothetical protein
VHDQDIFGTYEGNRRDSLDPGTKEEAIELHFKEDTIF